MIDVSNRTNCTVSGVRMHNCDCRANKAVYLRDAPSCSQIKQYTTKRKARNVSVKLTADDEPPELRGDWRAFRAGLIARTDDNTWNGGVVSDENLDLLRQQDPVLAEESVWAHAVEQIEPGSILLASVKAPGLVKDPRMWQLVVFLLEHGKEGSRGVILNRPAMPLFGDLLRLVELKGDLARLNQAFCDNPIYLGGMYSPNKMSAQKLTILHPHKELENHPNGSLAPSRQIVPGVFVGGEVAGAEMVQHGRAKAESFRFFAGSLEWAPEQLALEVNSGIWPALKTNFLKSRHLTRRMSWAIPLLVCRHVAACSRNLVVKQCLQLPVPLWREIMDLLGGEYAKAAEQGNGAA